MSLLAVVLIALVALLKSLAHSAHADLCRQLGRTEQARASCLRALELTQQAPQRRFIERRIGELEG